MNTVFVKKVIINVLTKLPRGFEGLASKKRRCCFGGLASP